MSSLSAFMAGNAIKDENIKYVASKRFVEDGKPVEWEIQSISSEEDEAIRKACTKRIPIPGKKGAYTPETDINKYLGLVAVKCTVFPNLNDKELQDSYGVMGGDALLKTMLKPGEYQNYLAKIQEVNGFDVTMEELVDEAKN
ncbi:MAG: phage portal protein [Clostridia bacterium]|nr:phage portal protein [Clostridia bacterium]